MQAKSNLVCETYFPRKTKFFENRAQSFSHSGLLYSNHSLAGYSECGEDESQRKFVREFTETKIRLLLKGQPVMKPC